MSCCRCAIEASRMTIVPELCIYRVQTNSNVRCNVPSMFNLLHVVNFRPLWCLLQRLACSATTPRVHHTCVTVVSCCFLALIKYLLCLSKFLLSFCCRSSCVWLYLFALSNSPLFVFKFLEYSSFLYYISAVTTQCPTPSFVHDMTFVSVALFTFWLYFWNNWINASKFECSFIPSQNLSRAMWTHAQTVGNMMFLGLRLIFMCPTGSSRHHVCSASGVTWRHLWPWSSSSFDKRKFCSKHINDWCNSSQLLYFHLQ